MVYRLRLPECGVSDSVNFPAESAATRRYFDVDDRDIHLLKSESGYWLFVPTRWGGAAPDTTAPSIYVCRLDTQLEPVRSGAASIESVRPYSEAPRGSIVRIDVKHKSRESWHPELGGDSAWHTFTLRFLAFGTDGCIYSTETRDSVGFVDDASLRDTSVRVTGGGDSVGHAIVTLPAFPRTAGYVNGISLVSAFVNAEGRTDSVRLTPQMTKWFDDAAVVAARKTRLTGRIFGAGGHGIVCDIAYQFSSGERLDEEQTVSVWWVKVRAE